MSDNENAMEAMIMLPRNLIKYFIKVESLSLGIKLKLENLRVRVVFSKRKGRGIRIKRNRK